MALPTPAFVPLRAHADGSAEQEDMAGGEEAGGMIAENSDQGMLRRRKELNAAITERPYELQPWLDLCALEDKGLYAPATRSFVHQLPCWC